MNPKINTAAVEGSVGKQEEERVACKQISPRVVKLEDRREGFEGFDPSVSARSV